MRILIVYGTNEGQTRRIAEALQGQFEKAGHRVELHQGDRLPRDLSVTGFDGVVIGASIHMSHHQPSIRRFIRDHLGELKEIPSAFFSVSASAASFDPGAQAQVRELAEVFLAEEGWRPGQWSIFAGAIPYTRYGRLKCWLMRMIVGRAGGPTDTSRDWELTDWEEVARFGEDFLDLMRRPFPGGKKAMPG